MSSHNFVSRLNMLRGPVFRTPARLPRPQTTYSTRLYTTSNIKEVHKLPKPDDAKAQEDDKDFRPPWVYTASRLTNFVLIPATFLYAIFVYDWGDHEHVFQPARRWAAAQKAAVFNSASTVVTSPPSSAPTETVASES